MAEKHITSRHSNYVGAKYDIETRTLSFVPKSGTHKLCFYGVPSDVYYGMPSGANLQNFIDLRLMGRYAMATLRPPPLVQYSLINQRVTIEYEDATYEWNRREGEPQAFPDSSYEAFALFQATYGQREADRKTTRISTKAGEDDASLPGL